MLDKNTTGLGAQPQNWSIGQRQSDGQLVLIFTVFDGLGGDTPDESAAVAVHALR